MTFKEFRKFIKAEMAVIEKRLSQLSRKERLLAYTVKASEEQGEMSEALLSYLSLQRKDKAQTGKDEMAGEVADVIITAALLAEALEIDFEKALEKKITKIKRRKY